MILIYGNPCDLLCKTKDSCQAFCLLFSKEGKYAIINATMLLPKNEQIYGLFHFNFELDNIFYDRFTDTLNIIDFDDSMYHWYATDIEQALDNIANEISCEDYSLMRDSFIKGYREEFRVQMKCYLIFLYLGYLQIYMDMLEFW